MSDEELLFMYRKYKNKRRIIIFIIVLIISIFACGCFIFLHFNNASSNAEQVITPDPMIVKDGEAPIIKLKTDTIEVLKGDDIDYLEYVESVIDNIDGNLMDKLKYQEIDTSSLEEQSIVYSVSDSSGNTSQEIIKVVIKEKINEEDSPSKENNFNSVVTSPPKETTTSQKGNNSSSNNEVNNITTKPTETPIQEAPQNKPTGKVEKYFLFSDGYTMSNVVEACANELKKINRTGMCKPLQDDNGIYLGMKLETN